MDKHADPAPATPLAIPEIVRLPVEIDAGNADQVRGELSAAARPGVAAVVGDMTATRFCDSAGVRALLLAQDAAVRAGGQLRLVTTSAPVLRVLSVLGVDRLFQIYPTLAAALAAGPPRQR